MNKKLLENNYVYPKVVLWWKDSKGNETELKLHNMRLREAYMQACYFGYKPPVWYKPWQYFTGGLGIVTVG